MVSEVKIENNLFNDKKMEEFIELYDDDLNINADCDPISYWIDKLENDELRNEKSNYIIFFKIILEKILGYQVTDLKFEENIGDEGRPVEFALKKEDKDYVVVELKGTTCKDLNKRYNREQSPIEQVTNYASIKEETRWAFVSNYNEFRLFNPSFREKYISFKFKQLRDPKVLKKFLLTFSKFSLIDKNIPSILLKETRIIERELEDEFYKLFSETRLMIIKELEHSSEDIYRPESIRLAQLILNRFIFLCFAEDLKLIPSETTADVILTPIKHKNLFENTMWNRLNELFRFADKGNVERGIDGFNGGLFKENLRHLDIRDKVEDPTFFDDCYKTWEFKDKYEEIESLMGVYKNTINPIYKNLLLISSFDFSSELSVNILGHIFENSIGDIEELKDQTIERRKKDGVFYTPEYITDYICRNTIIPYLSISGEVNTIHQLISEYESLNSLNSLDKKLKEIKIIDIACGSGAFLNKTVDVLFEIHEALHTSKYTNDETLDKYFDSLDIRRQIISNNIYGVDLNKESVEITKLSLFLKLATSTGVKTGFKLPNLDNNIKCGNSLVDDESIVGNKAFNWKNEFKDVINQGKFDIVIGNPPYIKENNNKEAFDGLRDSPYYQGKMDIWTFFGSVALDLIKENGLVGFIAPNNWITNTGASKFRKKVNKEAEIKIFKDFGNYKVFDSASIQTMIYIMQKNNKRNEYPIKYSILKNEKLENDQIINFLNSDNTNNSEMTSFKSIYNRKENYNSYLTFIDEKENKVLNKILTNENLFYLTKDEVSTGIDVHQDFLNKKGAELLNLPQGSGIFVISEEEKDNLNLEDNEMELIKPYYTSKEINRYFISSDNDYWVVYTQSDINNKISDYPHIKEHLDVFKDVITSSNKPYGLHRARKEDIFKNEKIIVTRKCQVPTFAYADFDTYVSQTFNVIKTSRFNLKILLGILNSDLIKFWLKNKGKMQGKNYQLDKEPLLNIPIKYEDNETTITIEKLVNKLLEDYKSIFKEIMGFNRWFNRTFDSNIKMTQYYELEYEEYLNYLKKNNINVKSRETQELLETEFNKSISIIKPLQNEIKKIKSKINQLVYLLYDLTDEEISIVENSFE